uniref:TonB box, N-terminal,domain-containing protein n=1 Tax=Schistosoma japonicum TaxID=6182 RepID=C1LHL6_SCHJA|nr:TonB box, N-terminal,domain-containing protein [Schistosoma japonicum]
MRAAVSIDSRQMSSLLYWFIPTVMYFNILFLDNSVALKTHYIECSSWVIRDAGNLSYFNETKKEELVFEDIGFTIRVQEESFKSLTAFSNGTFLVTNSENRFRSFRIVGGNVTSEYTYTDINAKSVDIDWYDMPFCSSNPEVLVDVIASIDDNGFVEFFISWSDTLTKPCVMRIEIIRGVFGKDGNIVKQSRVHSTVFKMDGVDNFMWIGFIPQKENENVYCPNSIQ